MALASYKDLCIDATDALRLGDFWAAVLRLDLQAAGDESNGDYKLLGPTPQHTVWVNEVPEPKSVKHRVHLDVNVGSVAELERLGATVVDDSFAWIVMADPEGGEFCAFVRDGEIGRRLYEIGIDAGDSAEDSHRIAAWWADVLGARLQDDTEHGYSYVEEIPGAPYESLDFAPVPEPKTVKNRLHLDVVTPDLDALVASGATVLRPRDDDPSTGSGRRIAWTVMADPDGNEFCAFTEG